MSLYRDSLGPGARERYDAATGSAARVLADSAAGLASLAAAHGIRAAAEAAWYPGHRLGSVEAIEDRIAELASRGRARAA